MKGGLESPFSLSPSPLPFLIGNLMVSSQTSKSSILDKIVTHKQKEVANMRDRLPLSRLQHQIKDPIPARDFWGHLNRVRTNRV